MAGGRSKRKDKSGRRGSNGSTNAVLQGTANESFEISSAVPEDSFWSAGSSAVVPEEANNRRARIFDLRRIFIMSAMLFIAVVVVVGSKSMFGGMIAKPAEGFLTATATPAHPTEDGLPHLHKYAFVFVAYDKTGFTVAHQLYDQLEKSMEAQDSWKDNSDRKKHPHGGRLSEQFIDTHNNFNKKTKCTEFNLESSTVTILESPEFYCNMQKLRSLFMDHDNIQQEKWGVKLIHLVRNPFAMAVADYQEGKSPHSADEVRFKNPCDSLIKNNNLNMTGAALVSPILSENEIMTYEDFDNVLGQCNNLFQTQEGLETAGYQQHLERLPPMEGLKLSVADGLGSIAAMASDLISFQMIHSLVQEEASNPERKKIRHLDILTLPLDTALNYPGDTMMEFLSFVFGTSMSKGDKRSAATEYERKHIYDDSVDATERGGLIGILKNDKLIGEPLKRVESLLNSVLSEQEK